MTEVGLAASRRHPTGSKRAAPQGFHPANTGAKRTERAGRTATLGKPGGVGTSWPERFRAQREERNQRRPAGPSFAAARGSVSAGPGAAATGALRGGIPHERVSGKRRRRLQAGEFFPHTKTCVIILLVRRNDNIIGT